jgi:hypothetical protein
MDNLAVKEEILYRLNYEYKNKYVIQATIHAQNLSDYVDQYVGYVFNEKCVHSLSKKLIMFNFFTSLFSETRAQAANPLKASQAYKNIMEGLIESKQAATDANKIINGVNVMV